MHSELIGGSGPSVPMEEERDVHSFEIDPNQVILSSQSLKKTHFVTPNLTIFLSLSPQVERVKQECLPDKLNYPMLEEYDFRNDTVLISIFLIHTI